MAAIVARSLCPTNACKQVGDEGEHGTVSARADNDVRIRQKCRSVVFRAADFCLLLQPSACGKMAGVPPATSLRNVVLQFASSQRAQGNPVSQDAEAFAMAAVTEIHKYIVDYSMRPEEAQDKRATVALCITHYLSSPAVDEVVTDSTLLKAPLQEIPVKFRKNVYKPEDELDVVTGELTGNDFVKRLKSASLACFHRT